MDELLVGVVHYNRANVGTCGTCISVWMNCWSKE